MSEAKLKEWIIGRIRHQDLFTKKLKDINDSDEERILVDYIDKKSLVLIMPDLDIEKLLKNRKAEKDFSNVELITLNKKKNLSYLIKNWDEFSKISSLKIFFVNPRQDHSNFWIINPAVHNMITEKKALRPGLNSLFSSVEEV